MKTMIVIATLLGALLTQSLANDNVNVNNEGNVGGDTHQTVNINNQDHIAKINNINGWQSWDFVADYGKGFAATRHFGRRTCIVTKIDKGVFPTLAQLATWKQQKQLTTTPLLFKFNANQVPVANIGIYGVTIEALCKGLPSYTAEPSTGGEYSFDLCDPSSIITICGITFCF
ncbi:gastrokine-1-like isoform 1-T1 [Discoglossus pictus]